MIHDAFMVPIGAASYEPSSSSPLPSPSTSIAFTFVRCFSFRDKLVTVLAIIVAIFDFARFFGFISNELLLTNGEEKIDDDDDGGDDVDEVDETGDNVDDVIVP